jgi:hypothetical protein
VPESFWRVLFLEDNETLATLWDPVIGPIVAVISFVCSIGNVPLAAVLWNSGISFGGVIAFIFADLIVLPILDIYRRYYGWTMAGFLFVTFFAAMVGAALAIELAFDALGLIPGERAAKVVEASISWNYTTILNLAFVSLAAVLVWRFIRTGGLPMLKTMNRPSAGHQTLTKPRAATTVALGRGHLWCACRPLRVLPTQSVWGHAPRLVHIHHLDHEQHHKAQPGMEQVAPEPVEIRAVRPSRHVRQEAHAWHVQ